MFDPAIYWLADRNTSDPGDASGAVTYVVYGGRHRTQAAIRLVTMACSAAAAAAGYFHLSLLSNAATHPHSFYPSISTSRPPSPVILLLLSRLVRGARCLSNFHARSRIFGALGELQSGDEFSVAAVEAGINIAHKQGGGSMGSLSVQKYIGDPWFPA